MPRSIAVAQTCPASAGVQANVQEHVRLASLAAREGAQVVVFPELSLTGYELSMAHALAFSEHDSRLAPLVECATSHSITLIAGAPLRLGTQLHIAAFILGPGGAAAVYTKHHLGAFAESAGCDGTVPPAESTVFRPGDRNPTVRFDGNAAAVAICADIGRASHAQQAAARGAKTYLASMFVIPSEFEGDAAKLRGYAVEHTIAVAFANFGSPTGGLTTAGRSSIWSETGELLIQLPPSGSGVAVATETPAGWRAKKILLTTRDATGP